MILLLLFRTKTPFITEIFKKKKTSDTSHVRVFDDSFKSKTYF